MKLSFRLALVALTTVATVPALQAQTATVPPNIVMIMTDDVGFGASSPFGGPIPTPALDRLAHTGLRYNQFHTTALCSPTRAALKSGRNHHTVNMGFITEMATSLPGATGQIPNATAPTTTPRRKPRRHCQRSIPSSAARPTRCGCTCARWARSSC